MDEQGSTLLSRQRGINSLHAEVRLSEGGAMNRLIWTDEI